MRNAKRFLVVIFSSLILNACAGKNPFVSSTPPGIDATLVREEVVGASTDQVWTRLLAYVNRPAYHTVVASRESGVLSFAFITVPGDKNSMALATGGAPEWLNWRGHDAVAYEAEFYVTVLVTPIDPIRTKVYVRSLVRFLVEEDGEASNIAWYGGNGRLEREIFNAAKAG
ncbi:MAG: hypothetical protein MN733_25145 [Nitrososphaera sp.]|nr:hypothetical protein [Nitrososphaera sp.]